MLLFFFNFSVLKSWLTYTTYIKTMIVCPNRMKFFNESDYALLIWILILTYFLNELGILGGEGKYDLLIYFPTRQRNTPKHTSKGDNSLFLHIHYINTINVIPITNLFPNLEGKSLKFRLQCWLRLSSNYNWRLFCFLYPNTSSYHSTFPNPVSSGKSDPNNCQDESGLKKHLKSLCERWRL